MPKKAPKGPFYFFMKEYLQRCERNGERYPGGIADENLKENAGAEWSVLPPERRKKYEDLAKEDKARRKNDDTRKYTNMNRTFSSVDKMAMEQEEFKARMNSWIETTVGSLSSKKYLAEYKFYVVHINFFCITEGAVYHPAEIAIAEFSLGDGVTDVFHTLVEGIIPLGYKHDAMQKAEQTHQIPIKNDGEKSFDQVFRNIKKFLEPGRQANGGEYPPMFTMPDNVSLNTSMSCVQSVMKRFCLDADPYEDPDTYPVYSLEKLFFELKNACANVDQSDGWSLMSIVRMELERDVFNYTLNIACPFHIEVDRVEHCSKSFVQRWIFLICDHCCGHLDIKIVQGKHLPENANVNFRQAAKELEEKKVKTAPFTWKDHSKPEQKPVFVPFEEAPLPRPTVAPGSLANMIGVRSFDPSETDFPAFGRGRGFPQRGGRGGVGRGRGPEPLSFAGAAMKRK